MNLAYPDILTALGQLATTTSSDIHRVALTEAIIAVQFRNSIQLAIARHQQEYAAVLNPLISKASPGAPWQPEEDAQLRLEFEMGMTLDTIAHRHGRPVMEIASRLHVPLQILTEQAVAEIRIARSKHKPKATVSGETVPVVPMNVAPVLPTLVIDEEISPDTLDAAFDVLAESPEDPLDLELSADALESLQVETIIAEAVIDIDDVPTASPQTAENVAGSYQEQVLTLAPAEQIQLVTSAFVRPNLEILPEVLAVDSLASTASTLKAAHQTSEPVVEGLTEDTKEVPVEAPSLPANSSIVTPAPGAEVSTSTTTEVLAEVLSPAPVDSTNTAAEVIFTPEEEKAVTLVINKYTTKNAPKVTLRAYIESTRFTSKVRPAVLDWLRLELAKHD